MKPTDDDVRLPGPVRRGMILYIVAVVVVLMTVAAMALSSLLQTEHEATMLRGDELQITLVARSGVDYVAACLVPTDSDESSESIDDIDTWTAPEAMPAGMPNVVMSSSDSEEPASFHPGNLYNDPTRFAAVGVVMPRPQRPRQGTARFTVVAPRFEEERLAGIRYGLLNESSRLHLGAVLAWDQAEPGQGARSLMKLPGMTPSMADSILDWLDPDKTPRTSGAELDYYERAGLPYAPRNATPVALEELLLVRDVTRELLFGDDEAMTFGYRKSGERIEPKESLPWSLLMTTFSAEKQVDVTTGLAKIWLNESDLTFLYGQLEKRLGKEAADFVVLFRQSPAEPVEAVDPALPAKNRINSPFDLLDVTVAGRKSPFSLDGADAEERFLKLLDAATEREETIIYGRINVNEASRCVLESIPGMTPEIVTQILSRRGRVDAGGRYASRQRHPCWLAAEKIVDMEMLRRLWPNLTCGGDVWRAQVIAFYEGEGPACRLEAVLDATVKPPRQIYQKDLTLYGVGYPGQVLVPTAFGN